MWNHDWRSRTLWAFRFVQEYEFKPVLAFGNKVVVIGLPDPICWVANNDNKAKP